jgi:hypothetical protein
MERGKSSVKCKARIPADEVVLRRGEDERCHGCADFCIDPDCKRRREPLAEHTK